MVLIAGTGKVERLRAGRQLWLAMLLGLAACLQVSAAAGRDAPPAASTGTQAKALNGVAALVRGSLLGEHKLTLQWLGFGDLSQAGTVVIAADGEALLVKGEQSGSDEEPSGYVRIDGHIVSADQDGFEFTGDIVTRVSHIAEGAECRRSGTFHFQTRGVRKYWRLQEMQNPCSTVTDYVDIYFLGV